MWKARVEGCNHDALNRVEQSRLTLSFNKCREHGELSREDFGDKMRATNMYGPDITDDDVEALFIVYSIMLQTSPNHVSKNKVKQSGKPRKRKSSPKRVHTATAACPKEVQEEEVFHGDFVFFSPVRSSAVSQDDNKRIMSPAKIIERPLAMDVPLPVGLLKVTNYKCLECSCECAECQCSIKTRVLNQLLSV